MQDDDLCRLAEELAGESATLPILLVSIGVSSPLHLSPDQVERVSERNVKPVPGVRIRLLPDGSVLLWVALDTVTQAPLTFECNQFTSALCRLGKEALTMMNHLVEPLGLGGAILKFSTCVYGLRERSLLVGGLPSGYACHVNCALARYPLIGTLVDDTRRSGMEAARLPHGLPLSLDEGVLGKLLLETCNEVLSNFRQVSNPYPYQMPANEFLEVYRQAADAKVKD